MKYFTKEIGNKDYNFRLTSNDICVIENKTNKSIQEAIADVSFNNISMLFKYMIKGDKSEFKDSNEFMDFLVDEGYSLETMYTDIIYPTCLESGIITQNDLNTIMDAITEQHEKKTDVSVKQ